VTAQKQKIFRVDAKEVPIEEIVSAVHELYGVFCVINIKQDAVFIG
jgi:hypothetical protein